MSSTAQNFYQAAPLDEKGIADYVDVHDRAKLVMGVGPCRVGTKAQLFTMAASGYRSYDQPLKCILRSSSQNLEPETVEFDSGYTYFKETLGPYTIEESSFNPVKVLMQVRDQNWMRENVKVVFLVRRPMDTWMSWRKLWDNKMNTEILFSMFEESFDNCRRLIDLADSIGLVNRVFDYELNKNPEQEYIELFNDLTLENDPVVNGWDTEDVRERIYDNMKFFKEPEHFIPEDLMETIRKSGGIIFNEYEEIDDAFEDRIQRNVEPIYDKILSS